MVRSLQMALLLFSIPLVFANPLHSARAADTCGVLVHLGAGDGSRTLELSATPNTLVHALDTDAANVAHARDRFQQAGCYGRVAADTYDGRHLPYADNMINRIVVDDISEVSEQELLRVLAPGGTAAVADRTLVKPRPAAIDEWTHYLHGPDNNAVSNDTVVGPPRRLQWQAGPKWTRHHDHMSSLSALVSTGGRIFYIIDEGSSASIYLPSRWALLARDAFNGKLLWRQPIDQWYSRMKGLKDGPADAPRRLVAVDDRVYATLSLHGPVTELDVADGTILREFAGTEEAEEILLSDGVLFVLIGTGSLGDGARMVRPVERREIAAVDVGTGRQMWRITDVVAAMTMAVDRSHVYYLNLQDKCIVGLDRESGEQLWTSEPVPCPERQTSFFASKLVVHDGVVLLASGEYSGMTKSGGGEVRDDTLTAVDAGTGQRLWTGKHSPSGYSSPEDLYVIDDQVWFSAASNGRLNGTVTALDLESGAVKRRFAEDESNYWFHHRCYSGRATCNFMMTSRTGIEFIDLKQEHWDLNHWVRGACLYGIMPANGLVYTPPSPCICYAESMLHSFNAYAPAAAQGALTDAQAGARLEPGPAYGKATARPDTDREWLTYRADAARSGRTTAAMPAEMTQLWKTELGGRLSASVIDQQHLYVAAVDQHTLHALDNRTGAPAWSFTAGARIDSPPTIHAGYVLFGCADGYVYSLRAEDGQLAWRFRAAPADRRIVCYEQLESVWPVHGSILVRDGIAHFVAGRSIFVDDGMRYYRLDANTGKLISEVVLDDKNPKTGNDVQELIKWLNMPVGRPDILSSQHDHIYMRSQAFDLEGNRLAMGPEVQGPTEGRVQRGEDVHLFCPTGFLDDSWFHRTYWIYGQTWGSGWNGYFENGKYAPAGKIMTFDDDFAYVFGRKPQYYRWTSPMEFRLFAARKQWQVTVGDAASKKKTKKGKRQPSPPGAVANPRNYRWVTEIPVLVRGMVLAPDTLFIAGPRDVLDESGLRKSLDNVPDTIYQQESGLAGNGRAVLWSVSTADGNKLAEYDLEAPPVFDGMSAAQGRLYLSTTDGYVRCWGMSESQ